MKKFTALALAFAITFLLVPVANSQSRPRRVNSNPPSEPQTQSQSAPQQTGPSQVGPPPAPPVLRGANRDPNEQKPAAPQKDAGPEEVSEGDVVKVDTTLVSIPVAVMDRDGQYIPDLTKENFRIWENDVEQKVAYFASTEKPFTVALVIDTSASTRYKIEEIQDAAIAFVNQLRPDDKVIVVSFDDKIKGTDRRPTNDRNMLRNWILDTRIGSGTRLYDAVDQVINNVFSHIDGRKAIVLFTDGVDTTSKHATYETTLRDAEENDALIYPVEYDTSSDMGIWFPGGGYPGGGSRRGNYPTSGRNYPNGGSNPNGSGRNNPNGGNNPNGNGGNYPNGNGGGNYPNSNGRNNPSSNRGSGGGIFDILGAILSGGAYPSGGGYPGSGGRNRGGWPGGAGGGAGTTRAEYEIADQYLHDLARVSGARLYDSEQTNLSGAFQSVAEELRRQYSLGYYPKNAPQTGERRNIKVRVNRTELVVRTRDSYVFQPGTNQTAQSGTQQPAKAPVLKKDYAGTQWH